jgi:S-DNA-T family DNA segregation ATPase FtsK/SpoIIIE
VTRLSDDLALNLKVPSVRIVAPIPGKNTVGIEIPNEHRAVVRLKEVILSAGPKVAKSKIPLFLGKDTEGRPLVYDLAEMPHLLIAGRTGTGKSVCMNAIILSMLVTRRPDEVKMIMIDPKMLELSEYGKIPHLMHPVVKDMKKAEAILSWAVDKMEERYDVLCRARVRNIAAYNELSLDEIHRRIKPTDDDERARIPPRMPYIVIFVDEMNDLMMTMKKEVEGHIIRLAQKSRAAGIHLVVATQKPTVDVITGLIKSNLPARICFQVSSRVDSRVVLDEMGADKLLGKGDMLFLQPGTSTLVRAQGTYTADEEISRVVEFLECDPCFAQELVQLTPGSAKEGKSGGFLDMLRARDEVYEAAIDVVVREGRGSVSLLQRALGIGYGRAARLVDFMAEDGIVGDYNGSQARDVLYTPEQWTQVKQTGQIPKAG